MTGITGSGGRRPRRPPWPFPANRGVSPRDYPGGEAGLERGPRGWHAVRYMNWKIQQLFRGLLVRTSEVRDLVQFRGPNTNRGFGLLCSKAHLDQRVLCCGLF